MVNLIFILEGLTLRSRTMTMRLPKARGIGMCMFYLQYLVYGNPVTLTMEDAVTSSKPLT